MCNYVNNPMAKERSKSSGSGSGDSATTNPESPTGATSGGNGSVIQLADGTTFTYENPFGGTCACRKQPARRTRLTP